MNKTSIDTDSHTPKIYTEDDFIFCKTPAGEITSCGFSINSALMREGRPPIMSIQSQCEENDNLNSKIHYNVADLFKNKAIPAGLFYIQQKHPAYQENNMYEEAEDINADIFDKLLALASEKNTRRPTTRKKYLTIGGTHKKSKKIKKNIKP